MRGVTHAVIGANTAWIPLIAGAEVAPWIPVLGCIAALLPDLDASESMIKHMSFGGYIGKTRVRFKPFVPIAMIASGVFGHRGALHSLVAVVLVALGASFLIPYITIPGFWVVVMGYASHLAADALTKSGIEAFWPFKLRVGLLPRFLRVKTGGIVDTILLLVGVGGIVLFLNTFML
ncbi:MAG: metal-dependent hydrolase [Patescibacteria group bacterium]|jgi:inner membrane protein